MQDTFNYGSRDERYVIYARESSADVNKSPDLESQIEMIKDYISNSSKFSKLELYSVYKDRASGGSWRRPGFTRMISEANANKFKYIFITHRDRFARDAEQFAHYFRMLINKDVDVFNLNDNSFIDMRTSEGRTVNQMMAVIDEAYRTKTGEKVKLVYEHKKRKALEKGVPLNWGRTNYTKYVEKDKLIADIVNLKLQNPDFGMRRLALNLPAYKIRDKYINISAPTLRRFMLAHKDELNAMIKKEFNSIKR